MMGCGTRSDCCDRISNGDGLNAFSTPETDDFSPLSGQALRV